MMRTLRQMIDHHFASTTPEQRAAFLAECRGPTSPEEELCFGGSRDEWLSPPDVDFGIDMMIRGYEE